MIILLYVIASYFWGYYIGTHDFYIKRSERDLEVAKAAKETYRQKKEEEILAKRMATIVQDNPLDEFPDLEEDL